METKRELKKQLKEAIQRETNHFIALEKITKAINISELKKEPYVFAIQEIKKVLATDFETNS